MTNCASLDISTFSSCQATKKLAKLAQNPPDLTSEKIDLAARMQSFYAEAAGFKLIYGSERVSDDILQALFDLSHERKALDMMHKMQNGEIVNFIEGEESENRPALHTAMRDLFSHPNSHEEAKKAASLAKSELSKLETFLKNIDASGEFEEIISIGIGGSDLGPKAIYFALRGLFDKSRKAHFISNVDPDDTAEVLKEANLKKSLVVVISKSGTTLETEVNEQLVRQEFRKHGIDDTSRFLSITTPNTPMDNKNKYREVFHLWDWIGGRYSVTSMVGAVVLSFAFGIDTFKEFLHGAHEMDMSALKPKLKDNLPLLLALLQIWNRNFLNHPTLALIPYSQALLRYPAHIQQVAMESNGKSINRQGERVDFETSCVIWGEPGTNGQHSFFQLLHQGTQIVPAIFIGFKEQQSKVDIDQDGTCSQQKLLANMFAQSIALATGQKSSNTNKVFEGNRPTSILLAKKLCPKTLGSLLSLFENMIAFQGFIWGNNSFDQEGVQLGKVLAKKIIERFKAQKNGTFAENSFPAADALLQHLGNLQ